MAELSPSPAARPALWLDELPPEIRTRIAAYISSGVRTKSALSLAEASEDQRQAVLSTLSHRFRLDPCDDNTTRWVAVFENAVQYLELMDADAFSSDPHSGPLRLFQSPSLLRANIHDGPPALRAITGSASLRELTVNIEGNTPTERLLEALSTLQLSSLQLECDVLEPTDCPFQKLARADDHDGGTPALAAVCPNLIALKLICWNFSHKDALAQIIPTLPALREVTVATEVPEDALAVEVSHETLAVLRGLETVKILRAGSALQAAMELGSSVTYLRVMEALDAVDVARLIKCSRLEDLRIALDVGAERSLVDAVRSMPDLHTLKLVWTVPDVLGPPEDKWYPDEYTTDAAVGVMPLVVENAPKLVNLSMLGVHICADDMVAVLKFGGKHLEHLETTIAAQEDSPFDRLETLMEAMTAYNPGLEVFRFNSDPPYEIPGEEVEAVRQQACRMQASLPRLKRRAPMLNMRYLNHYIMQLLTPDIPQDYDESGGSASDEY